jgi:hypothetical protein
VNARLPEYMARVAIKDVVVGEQVYTVPWSVQVDQDGNCWIRGDYTFTHRRVGTSQMAILRTAEGFAVQVCEGTRYQQVHIAPEARSSLAMLPVVKME